jgi:hypothetical protein
VGTPNVNARIPADLVDAARAAAGLSTATRSDVIREALARMAGASAPTLRPGRPRKVQEITA